MSDSLLVACVLVLNSINVLSYLGQYFLMRFKMILFASEVIMSP